MVLTKVEYELFEFEDQSPVGTELARQIRLHFSDAATVYISWTWENSHSDRDLPYSLGIGPATFFRDEPFAVVDASGSFLWQRHLGRAAELRWRDSGHQVLELRTDRGSVHLFSQGRDVIQLAVEAPAETSPNQPLQPTSGGHVEVK